jgi:uncharacterized protein
MKIKTPSNSAKAATSESPCSGVCKLNETNHYCLGCFRTRADIGLWSAASEAEKIQINTAAIQRAAQISISKPGNDK